MEKNPDLRHSVRERGGLILLPLSSLGSPETQSGKHRHEMEPDNICHCALYKRPTRRTCLYRQISMSVTIMDTNRKLALTTSAGTRAMRFIVAGSTTLQAGPPMLRPTNSQTLHVILSEELELGQVGE